MKHLSKILAVSSLALAASACDVNKTEEGEMPDVYDKLLPAYHEALDLYRKQDWKKAIDAFKTSDELEDMFPGRKTNPSRVYIPRCEHYMENPPGDDWDGSWALTSK